MHAPYDRRRDTSRRSESKSGSGFLILPAIVAFALITLAIMHPKASIWISQAAQAEFGGYGTADDMPVETVQPPGMKTPMQPVPAD